MQFIAFAVLGRRIRAIPIMLRDKSVKKRKKILIILGFVYLFTFQFLFPVIGQIGAVIIWIWIIWYLREELDKYWIGEKPQDLSKKYRGKTVINDVDYKVEEEEGKK